MQYLEFLRSVHELLEPERYLEIGIRNGASLSLAKCRAIGIDPAYNITAELDGDIALFRTSSDEYFSRPEPLAPTGGRPFDLAFIDGLHLIEFALRDFINTERVSTSRSVIVFDDILPRSVAEAARLRHTDDWTGDVYSILDILARFRPELTVIPVATQPTGLLLVMGLDPANRVLAERYDDILAEVRRPDPQPVPEELMDRLTVVAAQRVLDAPCWGVLATKTGPDSPEQIRRGLADALGPSLGPHFARQPAA